MAHRQTNTQDANPLPQRILLIEDEAILAMDMSCSLTEAGFGIGAVARTRAEAFYHAKRTDPDLLLCDVALADGSSGITACEDIFREIGERPLIFISGDPNAIEQHRFDHKTRLIEKPFKMQQLVDAIAQVLTETPQRPE